MNGDPNYDSYIESTGTGDHAAAMRDAERRRDAELEDDEGLDDAERFDEAFTGGM